MKTSCFLLLVILGLVPAGRAGAAGGALHPCPSSPNCVCSEPPDRSVAPLPVAGEAGWARLRAAVLAMGGRLESEDGGYLHATFSSRVFGFVDDLECRRDGDVAQVRSAARTGWWDMGVNRRRVERLRALLSESAGR